MNNQATQLQAQIQGDAQIIIQLQTQLATANNNFDLLNHAHNFQTGQLQTCQADLQNWHRKHIKRKGKHTKQKAKHKKWENKEKDSRLRIINLNQQILALQNNLQDMAQASRQHIYLTIAPKLAQIPTYIGQEPPDDYCNRIAQAISYADTLITDANTANANTFTDAHKADIYKSQMGGKYLPVPAQYPNGTNIDTPARFRIWLRFKYQQEMVGTQQVAIQRLAFELFMPTDTPETYENRIQPFLLGVPNDDANALGFLMKHLPDEIFTRMKVAQPADIDAFFTNLKNMWLELVLLFETQKSV